MVINPISMGASASIFAYGDDLTSSGRCYATKDGTTYEGVWTTIGSTSGFLIGNLEEYGIYTVTAVQGSSTASVGVLVDAVERFDVEITFS